MKRISHAFVAALAVLAMAAVGPTAASAAPPVIGVTIGQPSANSWAKTLPSLTFTTKGTGLSKKCYLSGPNGYYVEEELCSSPFRPGDVTTDGTYTYSVIVENIEYQTASDSVTFNVDQTAPTVYFVSAPTEGSAINANSVTMSADVFEPNAASVECWIDLGTPAACGSSGVASATYSNLGEGPHKLSVRVIDKAGNLTLIARNFIIDRTPPNAAILLVGGGSETNDNTPAFTIGGNDAYGPTTKRCRIENQIDWVACSNETWVTPQAIADGAVTAWIEVSDRAGNKSFASQGFTLDSTMPTITVSGFDGAKTTSTTPAIAFSVDDIHKGAAACGFDPAGWDALPACTEGPGHVPASALALGSHQFWVAATDTFGNVASAIYNFEVVAVTPPPLDSPPGGDAGQALVNVKAKSSKVKKGKFTLALTITATGPDACQKTRIVIAPKVKKAKAVTLRPLAGKKGTACVASAKIKLAAKFKKKKATVTVTHGSASKQLTIKL